MASLLVLSFSEVRSDPRVMRQIRALKDAHAITSCGYGTAPEGALRHVAVAPTARGALARLAALAPLKFGLHDWYYWSHPRIHSAAAALAGERFDLVLANDLITLPLALRTARGAPVLFDAHEFAPLEYEDRWIWRYFLAPHNDALCRRYLSKAAAACTVCQGIAERYERDYGVKMHVVTNAAPWEPRSSRPTDSKAIRVIHHGGAIASRRTEAMIEAVDLLDTRFSLDLVLVPGDARYIERLRRLAAGRSRIRFLEPVPMEQLVALSAGYDIGLFLLPPTNFNYEMALPNKLFEFIQARVAVAIGPSPEMARIVREFGCGVVADGFAPEALAAALNALTPEDVDRMKAGSDRAARVHNAEANAEKLRAIVGAALESGRTMPR